MEIEGEKGSPSQNERTLREVGEGSKTINGEQGGRRDQNSGILSEGTF